ncbi:MAG TPA: hypothetical protein VFX98_08580 [Longimicrobiaceae bacterium]|nr:hypothetical protein [Longimicrobiaceae bacterium]
MRSAWFAPLAAAALAGLASTPGHAQVFTPSYMGPILSSDVGIYLSDGPGDLGIEGIWRATRGGYDLGIRAGYADIGEDGALMVGVEVRNPVVLSGAPIGLALTASAQGIVGDFNVIGGALGFTAGQAFTPQGSNFTLTPYIHPRLALLTGNLEGEDDLETTVLADLGIDLGFQNNFTVRFSAGLASEQADFGLGISWRM